MSVYFLSLKIIGILTVCLSTLTLHTSHLFLGSQSPTYPHPAMRQVTLGSKSLAWLETAYKDRFHFNLGVRLIQDMKTFEVHPGFP